LGLQAGTKRYRHRGPVRQYFADYTQNTAGVAATYYLDRSTSLYTGVDFYRKKYSTTVDSSKEAVLRAGMFRQFETGGIFANLLVLYRRFENDDYNFFYGVQREDTQRIFVATLGSTRLSVRGAYPELRLKHTENRSSTIFHGYRQSEVSLQLRKDHKELNTEGLPYGDIAVSGDTVTVGFTSGQFINQIKILQLFVVPKHIWSSMTDPVKDPNQKPIGTGPYTLTSWTDQAVILDQNPTYWGGKLAVPQLRYTSYSGNDTETTALATGECQWGWTFIADYQNVYVAKDAAHNKVFMPAGLGIDQLMLNVTKPPFNDVAVRKALNMVVDRKQASVVAESGLFPELTNITGIPTPAGDSFIADAYKNQTYKVDVAGAKKVLTDAGYTYDGDKLIGKDGKQVSFKLWVPAGWNDYVTSQQLIAQSAQSIGMNATTDTPTADAWFAANNTGDFDAALHWTNTGMTPFEMYSDMFDPAYYLPVGQQANWNLGRFQDDAAAAAFKAYTDATDDAGRKAALDTIEKIFVEQVPAIAVDARPAAAEYSTKYYVGWPDDGNAYANPQPTVANATWILTKLKPAS
ncbi:MAG: DUF560 domain-containing protein, partial [Cellulomonas sp.]|nr:DUF560 domain-containing protein [Cellulomonas sp.]